MLKQVFICTAIVSMLMLNPVIAQQNLQTMTFGTPIGGEEVKNEGSFWDWVDASSVL